MTAMVSVPATHLYPGMALRFDRAPEGDVMLLFSDGQSVPAEIVHADNGQTALAVPEHTTGRGTRIPAKYWHIRNRSERSLVLGEAQALPLSE